MGSSGALSAIVHALVLLPVLVHGPGPVIQRHDELEILSHFVHPQNVDQPFGRLVALYESRYPGVQVHFGDIAGEAGAAAVSRWLAGGKPLDLLVVHVVGKYRNLIDPWVLAGKLEPITFIFANNGWLDEYPKGVLDFVSYEGEIYSVPINIRRSNVLWYNKQVLERYDLAPPRTFAEFLGMSEALAKNGITPLALGDLGRWAAVQLLENVFLATIGPKKYAGLWTGATDWAGDEIREALTNFATLMRYVNRDHGTLSWRQAVQYLVDGKCATAVMGDWALPRLVSLGLAPNVDFGWMPMPGTAGSFIMIADSFALPKGAPHRNNAIEWLTLSASKQGQDAFNARNGSIPARIDADRSLLGSEYHSGAMDSLRSDVILRSVAFGNAVGADWGAEIEDAVSRLVSDLDVDRAAKALARAAATHAK